MEEHETRKKRWKEIERVRLSEQHKFNLQGTEQGRADLTKAVLQQMSDELKLKKQVEEVLIEEETPTGQEEQGNKIPGFE